ncbi:hypothetical protein EYF80_021361 [Liparis tanakae]|uniref:Uncharacterized protein n=1 Tax=Liparis tanakae TaxID=230148 RepID=A0A4Z2HS30_9TELE|nr:hypothetical protein EYF80_021361 [Liparis tanakae]
MHALKAPYNDNMLVLDESVMTEVKRYPEGVDGDVMVSGGEQGGVGDMGDVRTGGCKAVLTLVGKLRDGW